MEYVDSYIQADRQFRIFWPVPLRAHVGIDIDFKPVAFEVEQRTLLWSLFNAPPWMSIDPTTGHITGAPTSEATPTGTITLRCTRSGEDYVERTFQCEVNNSKFVFINPATGSDANPGTLASPKKTVVGAAALLNSTVGKTIYMRGGTNNESFILPGTGPPNIFDSKDRPTSDYHHLRGYPGEVAVWDYGTTSGGNNVGTGGWSLNCSGFLMTNITHDHGARTVYSKQVIQSVHSTAITDCVFRNLTGQDNLGGIETKIDSIPPAGTEMLIARNVFHGNSGSPIENSAGLMLFTNSGGVGSTGFQIWVLYNKMYNNPVGAKIKHCGLDRLVFQANEIHSCTHRLTQMGAPGLCFRYNISFVIGNTEVFHPNADNSSGPESFGGALFEKNTFVLSGAPSYLTNIDDGIQAKHGIIRNNIFASLNAAALQRIMRLWENNDPTEATADDFQIEIDYNHYYSAHSPTDGSFVVGTWSGLSLGQKNFTTWKGISVPYCIGGLDAHSTLADPQFVDGLNGNLNITSASPAATSGVGGTFCGAFTPDKTYGIVGVANTTLLNMNQNGDTPTGSGGGSGGGTSYSPGDTMGIFDPTLPNATFPGQSVLPVTPSDTNNWGAVRGLYIGGAGNVAIKTFLQRADPAVVFTSVPAGTLLPVNGYVVMATGTTATSILALY